jgi:endogenous inhibitor of DNA gyrase (YacG/DUF329 family)
MDIRIDFPLDADQFLRRECPSCSQEFKWHHGATENRPADAVDPPRYTCPLCGNPANHDEWFTQDQLRYQQETVEFNAMDAVNDEMKKAFGKNRKVTTPEGAAAGSADTRAESHNRHAPTSYIDGPGQVTG